MAAQDRRGHGDEHAVGGLGAHRRRVGGAQGRDERALEMADAVVVEALVGVVALDATADELGVVGGDEALLVLPALVDLDARAEEVGDVAGRRADGEGLPVDGDHVVGVVTEHQVVEPVVAVDDRERLGTGEDPVGHRLAGRLQRLDVAVGEVGPVALDEDLDGRLHHVAEERRALRGRPLQEVEVVQRRVAPARGVEAGEVEDRRLGPVDRAAVGLHARDPRARGPRAGA